jgi:transglutaminase-like putative cysteine protease
MRYEVRHLTRLDYGAPAANARFNLRLKPADWPGQTIQSQNMTFSPVPDVVAETVGPYCVNRTHLEFRAPVRFLEAESRFAVDVAARSGCDETATVAQVREQALAAVDISPLSPAPYLFTSRIVRIDETIGKWATGMIGDDEPILSVGQRLANEIHAQFAYKPGATDSSTLPQEAFERREGVCQDFAHVMIAALRAHGIPAAYASGYLRTVPPPGRPRLIGADAMHAWVNVWCGGEAGWIGIDPTNDCMVSEDHIQIGMGRDYADVSPIEGNFVGSAPQAMRVSVDVQPIPDEA